MRSLALILSIPVLTAVSAPSQLESENDDATAGPGGSPRIERLSDTAYRLGGIRFRRDTREISFPAKINLRDEFLEYLLVHENGKLHESLLSTPVSPYHLQIVLLLCGYKPGAGDLFERFQAPESREGAGKKSGAGTQPAEPETRKPDRLLVGVEWETEGGTKSARVEDWILNLVTNKAMTPGSWAYTGSLIIDSKFQAEVEGSILAIYLDDLALGNYPGPGNDRDDIWVPFAEKMPPLDSNVRVTLRPAPRNSSNIE